MLANIGDMKALLVAMEVGALLALVAAMLTAHFLAVW
jgi:hypothetical protein